MYERDISSLCNFHNFHNYRDIFVELVTESETSITRLSFPRNLELYVFLGVNKAVINLNFFIKRIHIFPRFFKRVTAEEME